MAATSPASDIIEGEFRVLATRDEPVRRTFRNSPNLRRALARIFVWNCALVALVVGLPLAL